METVTLGSREQRLAVYSFTRGQASDTDTNVFVEHMANDVSTTLWTSAVRTELFNNA